MSNGMLSDITATTCPMGRRSSSLYTVWPSSSAQWPAVTARRSFFALVARNPSVHMFSPMRIPAPSTMLTTPSSSSARASAQGADRVAITAARVAAMAVCRRFVSISPSVYRVRPENSLPQQTGRAVGKGRGTAAAAFAPDGGAGIGAAGVGVELCHPLVQGEKVLVEHRPSLSVCVEHYHPMTTADNLLFC